MALSIDRVESISIDPSISLEGHLRVPSDPNGLVIFAHGSGSSRHSPRNNAVASIIHDRGIGTLLFDLLTEREDETRANRFDISLLGDRLLEVSAWTQTVSTIADLDLGYFGSSTGAAAAIYSAVRSERPIEAVVARGGRVDMAAEVAADLTAPTLFIVGERDNQVLEWNREVYELLAVEKALHIVEGAGHLFEGPGQLEEVATVAADWFERHLGR